MAEENQSSGNWKLGLLTIVTILSLARTLSKCSNNRSNNSYGYGIEKSKSNLHDRN